MSNVQPESGQLRPFPARGLGLRSAEWLLVAVALAGAAALLVRLTSFEYGLDQGIYAVVSDALLQGGAPYRDAWDFKPPGVFAVYALARGVLGPEMSSVRIVEALAYATLPFAFAILSRRFVGSALPGGLGAALAISGHVWLGFWHTGQPESFGAVLLAWALVAATVQAAPGSAGVQRQPGATDERARRRQSIGWLVAGALYAGAALLKPPLGGGILVSAGFTAQEVWRRTPAAQRTRALLCAGLAYAGGGALPIVATLAFFAVRGALPDLVDALFVFAPEYTRINYETGSLLGFGARAVGVLGLRFSYLNLAGLSLLVFLPRLAASERRGLIHVLGVVGFVVLGVALQGRFFAYHYGAALPLLALLAGWGLAKLARWAPRGLPLGVAAVALLVVGLANANGLEGPVAGGFLERVVRVADGRSHNAPKRRVATWVATHTEPSDPIYVWGFEPALYDLARRRPASRYVYNAPQRTSWAARRTRPVLITDLRAADPAAILVERGDVHPGTTGNSRDSETALERFPALASLLAERYREAERVGDFTIYLRRPQRSPSARELP